MAKSARPSKPYLLEKGGPNPYKAESKPMSAPRKGGIVEVIRNGNARATGYDNLPAGHVHHSE